MHVCDAESSLLIYSFYYIEAIYDLFCGSRSKDLCRNEVDLTTLCVKKEDRVDVEDVDVDGKLLMLLGNG